MRLTIVNVSSTIKLPELKAVVTAINRQVTEHFRPEWHISAKLRAATSKLKDKKVPIKGEHDAIIYVGDSSQDPTTGVDGAYGYHSTNYSDIPYGFVYLDVCAKKNEKWSCTLSHEVLELLADPFATLTVSGPDPHSANKKVHFDLEVCDPTQDDTYLINNVVVSNFVTRAYFKMKVGKVTNYLNLPLKPFGVRPGGYFQYEVGNKTLEVDGKRVAASIVQHREARMLMKNGRRNARRATRLKGK